MRGSWRVSRAWNSSDRRGSHEHGCAHGELSIYIFVTPNVMFAITSPLSISYPHDTAFLPPHLPDHSRKTQNDSTSQQNPSLCPLRCPTHTLTHSPSQPDPTDDPTGKCEPLDQPHGPLDHSQLRFHNRQIEHQRCIDQPQSSQESREFQPRFEMAAGGRVGCGAGENVGVEDGCREGNGGSCEEELCGIAVLARWG